MAIRGAKTIAEYMIRRWLGDAGFSSFLYTLTMDENVGTVTDSRGDTLTLVYDSELRLVYVKDE